MNNSEPSIQADHTAPLVQADQSEIKPPSFNYEASKYYGVGGWLAFLCVSLIIIGPLFRLRGIIGSFENIDLIASRLPAAAKVVYIETFFQIILLIFSVYVGYSLWQIKPNAVYKAKTFLIAAAFFSVFDLFLIQFAGFHDQALTAADTRGVLNIFQVGFYVAIWFAYLSKSERVRATYSESSQENYF